MQATTHAAVAALLSHVADALPEIRERCAETTYAKFVALSGDTSVAITAEGITSDAPAGPAVDVQAIANAVSERLAMEVADAVGDAFDARNIPQVEA